MARCHRGHPDVVTVLIKNGAANDGGEMAGGGTARDGSPRDSVPSRDPRVFPLTREQIAACLRSGSGSAAQVSGCPAFHGQP